VAEKRPFLSRFAGTVLKLLRFFSRLPVPVMAFEREPHGLPEANLAAPAMIFAGALITAPSLLVLVLADFAGATPLVSAALALAALVITSGGLHEDGLADTMDAFSGGRSKERALEIMRDSRIGAHGALAVIISFALQWTALSAILQAYGLFAALAALKSAAIFSRVLCLAPLALLPPARADGRGAGFGKPSLISLTIGVVLMVDGIIVAALLTNLTLYGAAIGMLSAMLSVRLIMSLADKTIGGQTGDICGACQQLAFCALLLGFSLR
jgi:adenosylcobinamide-GDP ribazoletransferase